MGTVATSVRHSRRKENECLGNGEVEKLNCCQQMVSAVERLSDLTLVRSFCEHNEKVFSTALFYP